MKHLRFNYRKYSKYVVNKNLYNKWIKCYPEYSHYTYSMFLELVKQLIYKYRTTVIENTDGVRLPFYLGDMSVKYTNIKALDINKSIEYEKPIVYKNITTFRKNAKLVYKIDRCVNYNVYLRYIGFKPTRSFAKDVSDKILKKPTMYKNIRL